MAAPFPYQLPNLSDIRNNPPYHAVVHASSKKVVVECSHPDTLELLAELLKKNVLTPQEPFVKITAFATPFGPLPRGRLERLEIKAITGPGDVRATGVLLLSILEGMLGYQRVDGKTGASSSWLLRRADPFTRQ